MRRSRSGSRPPTPRPALAAAAAADSESDSDPDAPALATAAPVAPTPAAKRPDAVYCYTGDRAADEDETRRRRRLGLCLRCPPGAPKMHGACPDHDTVTSAPACRIYRNI